jgi:hypothetical protein
MKNNKTTHVVIADPLSSHEDIQIALFTDLKEAKETYNNYVEEYTKDRVILTKVLKIGNY